MTKTSAPERPPSQATPHDTFNPSAASEHGITKRAAFVAKAKTLCSRMKNTIFRKLGAFRFLDLPDELGIRIISTALEAEEPRLIVISRPPRPKTDNCMIDDNAYDSAGLYSPPHPFTLVSSKFRQMTLMARKPTFAVYGPRGDLIAPARIFCVPERDLFVVFQSVLEYHDSYDIPDLKRCKEHLIFCRSIFDQASFRRLLSLPHDATAHIIHEGFCRAPRTCLPKHIIRHGLLPEEKQIIYDLINRRRSYLQSNADLRSPKIRWIRLSSVPPACTPRGPVIGWAYLQAKFVKDKATLWLHFKLNPEHGVEEIIRRQHWVRTGHWSKNIIIDEQTGKCKCNPKIGRPRWKF